MSDSVVRVNVIKRMASLKNIEAPMMIPGIRWNTGANDFYLIKSDQLARFDGKHCNQFGGVTGN